MSPRCNCRMPSLRRLHRERSSRPTRTHVPSSSIRCPTAPSATSASSSTPAQRCSARPTSSSSSASWSSTRASNRPTRTGSIYATSQPSHRSPSCSLAERSASTTTAAPSLSTRKSPSMRPDESLFSCASSARSVTASCVQKLRSLHSRSDLTPYSWPSSICSATSRIFTLNAHFVPAAGKYAFVESFVDRSHVWHRRPFCPFSFAELLAFYSPVLFLAC
mmetsp:Transcript_12381/g.40653  ORF Transcript_12381/g.40653 Transcript_12381/m.40653 type:complete len:220 (-) Transcript_12381:38-697(-)